MSRRHELTARIGALRDVHGILEAMQSLAMVEVSRITGFIGAQRAALALVETVVDDFLRDWPPPPATVRGDLLIAFGAERGFCGDFNPRIADAVTRLLDASERPSRVVLVGAGLAGCWQGDAATVLAGPGVAEEVPGVLQRLTDAVAALLPGGRDAPPTGLLLVAQDASGIRSRRLLPLQRPPPARVAFPLRLNLPPARFGTLLTEQYLFALLHAALYDSLLEENRRRADHMESALHRLGERLDALRRQRNRERQEEITEEIEILLLSLEPEMVAEPRPGVAPQAAQTLASDLRT